MRLAALVVPNSSPKIEATRSNSASATRPQLRPPTMTSAPASRSSFFMRFTSCIACVQIERRHLSDASNICQALVQVVYAAHMADEAQLRIGELSRRSGVSPELLRAWERRYGLLRPQRSAGGLRLYSSGDLERVRAMQRHMTRGLAAREAAAVAGRMTAEAAPRPAGMAAFDPGQVRKELGEALEAFDEPRAQRVLDQLLSITTVDALLSDAVMPYLRDLGDRWKRGELSVAQEHFASNVLRGRLLGLARGWGRSAGPRALLACPEGE